MESNLKSSKAAFVYRHADVFNDNVTKSKISRHLSDINDVISEDDIRNIKVSISGAENILLTTDRKQEKLLTPWDILDA